MRSEHNWSKYFMIRFKKGVLTTLLNDIHFIWNKSQNILYSYFTWDILKNFIVKEDNQVIFKTVSFTNKY